MTDEDTGEKKKVTMHVWNPTIANLTLMALGSSAPEILLSIIETLMTLDEEPGRLGASTIVGSAAFNLLVISAVSIYAVDENDEHNPKKIDDLGVFGVTSIMSCFAYIWLYLVLGVVSPNEVEVWEAVLTLGFFVILIVCAFIADKIYERR